MSKKNKAIDDDLIIEYINLVSFPVHWMIWWTDLPISLDKERLHSILFDPQTGRARDMTSPSVRHQVARAAVECQLIRSLVEGEIEIIINEIDDLLESRKK